MRSKLTALFYVLKLAYRPFRSKNKTVAATRECTLSLRSKLRICTLTVSDAKNDIFTLIDAGADGYLLKDTEPDVLLEQIKRIAQGEVILSDSIKNLLLERKHTVDPMDSLTDREMDVLRLIATGLSNKQIAGQLFISEETVKVHIRNLLRKLNVHSRVAATVLFFERNGR